MALAGVEAFDEEDALPHRCTEGLQYLAGHVAEMVEGVAAVAQAPAAVAHRHDVPGRASVPGALGRLTARGDSSPAGTRRAGLLSEHVVALHHLLAGDTRKSDI
jgi:hypothetical protein